MEDTTKSSIYIKRKYLQFAEAKDTIRKVSKKRLKEIYSENISPKILDRYEYELKTIFDNNFENIYYLAYLIAKKAIEDDEKFMLRGSGSSSLIAYLLEISYINPIEYNIPFETFSHLNGDFEPDFVFNFRPKYNEKIHKYIVEMFGKDKIKYPEISYNLTCLEYYSLTDKLLKVDFVSYEGLELLKRLEEKTGVNCDKVNLNDEKIYKLFEEDKNGNINTDGLIDFDSDFAKEIIRKVKPKTIEDVIKVYSLIHGTDVWDDNIEHLIGKHEISDLPCSRDDIFLYLLEKGIDRKNAFEIMEFIRKGRAYKIDNMQSERKSYYLELWENYKTVMRKFNIPDWYIASLEKIRYMFPKAHSCNYAVLMLILAWYKVYYPNI